MATETKRKNDLLTLKEAAERLRVTPRTVRRWIKEGDLAACKAGTQYRIRESDLREFLTDVSA